MKVKHFSDSDTLYTGLCSAEVDETRDFDEDTPLELDSAGHLCALTSEHASTPHAYPVSANLSLRGA